MDVPKSPDRRRLLQAGAAVAAASLLPGVASANSRQLPSPAPTPAARPPHGVVGTPDAPAAHAVVPTPEDVLLGHGVGVGPVALFAPLTLGAEVVHGWTLADVRAPDRGALLVTLRRGETDARVHVCRHEGCGAGVAQSAHLDFLLMNGGHGSATSDEELGLAVMHLAALADSNGEPVALDGLLTHEERIATFGLADPGVLR